MFLLQKEQNRMVDIRISKLAHQLVNYSLSLQEGEVVRIVAHDFESKPLVKELIKEILDEYQTAINVGGGGVLNSEYPLNNEKTIIRD